jgi:hypothetical protein
MPTHALPLFKKSLNGEPNFNGRLAIVKLNFLDNNPVAKPTACGIIHPT